MKKVFVQGDAPFRMLPEDVNRWYVRNAQGGMVPFSAFSTAQWALGSPKLERFNGSPSVSILGEPAPGHSSGEAMREIEQMAKALPPGIGIEWAGLSYEERLSGSKSTALYTIALVMVFLCLAALYESWAIPFSVMMDMPLGALGVVAATSLRGMPNDIYFQIGLITIIGLSAKNAILVVEFAKEHFDRGATLVDAALHAVRQRLRPILMTSIAFGLGVLPLALSNRRRLRQPERDRHRHRRRRHHHDPARAVLRAALFRHRAAALQSEADARAGRFGSTRRRKPR